MKQRIKTFVIITDNSGVLLIKHNDPLDGKEFRVLPGGGMEDEDSDIYACATREAFEETGLRVELDRIVYVDEFFDKNRDILSLQIYMVASSFTGTPSLENTIKDGPFNEHICDLRWMNKDEMSDEVVFPEELHKFFWSDLKNGFTSVRYLGRRKSDPV